MDVLDERTGQGSTDPWGPSVGGCAPLQEGLDRHDVLVMGHWTSDGFGTWIAGRCEVRQALSNRFETRHVNRRAMDLQHDLTTIGE
jgi:hypothetical protein